MTVKDLEELYDYSYWANKSKLKDEELNRKMDFTNERGESLSLSLGSIMRHAANHSVHHRGQISLLLRMSGHAAGNIDILIYYALKNS
jgi:uncharacterized damage-inducible protein DinB